MRIVKDAICPGADQCFLKSFNVLCNLLLVCYVHLFGLHNFFKVDDKLQQKLLIELAL